MKCPYFDIQCNTPNANAIVGCFKHCTIFWSAKYEQKLKEIAKLTLKVSRRNMQIKDLKADNEDLETQVQKLLSNGASF